MAVNNYKIAQIAGDGIGPEVVGEARKVVDAVSGSCGFSVDWQEYPLCAESYLRTGEVLPASVLADLEKVDSILLGAIGDPRVKPGILERGILLTLRFHFDMYVNLRPARSFSNVPLPISVPDGKRLDALVVRENTEDLYMGIGASGSSGVETDVNIRRGLYDLKGRVRLDLTPSCAAAMQMGVATEPGIRRITARACDMAGRRGEKKMVLATKSNAMPHLYGFWEEIAADEASSRGMELKPVNVDALCYHLVRDPWEYGVILSPNLFGDIVSDLLAGLSGGLGVSAGANVGDRLGMFEPVHGSAPDIAGQGKANPIAAILSAGLMLSSLGEDEAAGRIDAAVENYLATAERRALPIELGGESASEAVGDAVASRL